MIVKVKEPQPHEYERFRDGQVLFTYLHLAADEALTRFLPERRIVAVAYETVMAADGRLPLLAPMSEIAGRMAPQEGAAALERPRGGRGVLMGGASGVAPARVVVLGRRHGRSRTPPRSPPAWRPRSPSSTATSIGSATSTGSGTAASRR